MSIDKLVDTHFESSQLVNTQLTYWTLLLWIIIIIYDNNIDQLIISRKLTRWQLLQIDLLSVE